MDIEIRSCSSDEELLATLNVIGHYFGTEHTLDVAERFSQWLDHDRMFGAWDGES